jgi:hypothetical protein
MREIYADALVLDDAVPEVAYPGRHGRERLRVLERLP